MNDITQSSYNEEIQDLATNMVSEAMDYNDNDREAAEESSHDRLHETIDGHQWVIYTHQAGLVPDFSSNYEAYQDCYDNESIGSIVAEGGLDAMKPIIAYFAMYQDVSELLEQAFDEFEDLNGGE